jgi:hypothetical protein
MTPALVTCRTKASQPKSLSSAYVVLGESRIRFQELLDRGAFGQLAKQEFNRDARVADDRPPGHDGSNRDCSKWAATSAFESGERGRNRISNLLVKCKSLKNWKAACQSVRLHRKRNPLPYAGLRCLFRPPRQTVPQSEGTDRFSGYLLLKSVRCRSPHATVSFWVRFSICSEIFAIEATSQGGTVCFCVFHK